MGNGITVGGNILVDNLKQIDVYPGEGMLAKILSESRAIGGCVTNTGISLKRLDPSLAVKALGCIGSDEAGEYILDVYESNKLDTSQIVKIDSLPTGYTDVFASKNGMRTFYVNQGTNALFDLKYIDFDNIDTQMIHLGYILLLDKMDSHDSEYGTVMARALSECQRRGIKTSVDVVSEDSDRFQRIVSPVLKYTDYLIINEIEAGRTVGISPRSPDGTLIYESLPIICEKLLDLGVSSCVIIHCPETGIYMDKNKKWTGMRALTLPEGYIKGSVGAGDAFCAGALLGIYNNMSPEELLRLGNCVAAGCLSSESGTDGVGTVENMLKLHKQYESADEVWRK